MRRLRTLLIGVLLTAAGFSAQAQQTVPGVVKQLAKPSTPPAAPPAAPQHATKAAKPGVKKVATTSQKAAAAAPEVKVARRDPFESLTNRQDAAAKVAQNLPPGKAGLQVASLRLDGIVKAPNGMIAVVTNPQSRTYFLREGDQLYDGRVEKIALDGVSFHEIGKDAFGRPVERQVNKRIYSSAGEQQ
jgi:type IV pilus assembly protein PilP